VLEVADDAPERRCLFLRAGPAPILLWLRRIAATLLALGLALALYLTSAHWAVWRFGLTVSLARRHPATSPA
jgi:hypothetical protein